MNNTDDYRDAPDAKIIIQVVDEIQQLLISKNKSYGASATNPIRIFSNASAEEGIRVRLDDKLSRVVRVSENELGEDTVLDLIGYLVLLLVNREKNGTR
jgi:hypothetical protein